MYCRFFQVSAATKANHSGLLLFLTLGEISQSHILLFSISLTSVIETQKNSLQTIFLLNSETKTICTLGAKSEVRSTPGNWGLSALVDTQNKSDHQSASVALRAPYLQEKTFGLPSLLHSTIDGIIEW